MFSSSCGAKANLERLSDRSQISKGINGRTRSGTQISWLLPVSAFSLFCILLGSFPQKTVGIFNLLTNVRRRKNKKKANGTENIFLQVKGTLTK